MPDVTATRQWLEILHGGAPGLVQICATDLWDGRVFPTDRLDEAANYAASLNWRKGVYARVTTINGQPAHGKRGVAEDSLALPALWADLDIQGPGHKAVGLPPDEEAARTIVVESGLPEPSAWIHSGGGLYPYWLLDRPHVINGDLTSLQALSVDWHKVIEATAARLGWHYGTETSDLARVLKLPGTVNRKEGLARPCRLLEISDVRHTLESLYLAAADRLRVLAPATASTPTVRGKRPVGGGPEKWREFVDSTPPQSALAAENAVNDKLAAVATWTKGAVGFRKVLLGAAFTLGGYVGAGHLDRAHARKRLEEAVSELWGSPDSDDLKWIRQGLRDGAVQPFHVYSEEQARQHSAISAVTAETPPLANSAYNADIADPYREPGPAVEAPDERPADRATPLDWSTFLTADFGEVDFLVGRLMVRGEQAALIGDGKAGKSLFALEWGWRMAAGLPFLGDAARDPVRVMYVDQENGHDDIQERLLSLGAEADTLTNLTYLSFPMFDPLNVAQGAAQLLTAVEQYNPDVIILDTISRMVKGKENESDTWLELYRVTLRPLKKRKVSCVRLDHFGKDATRGGRGNSAKTQDVDVVWELIPVERGSSMLRLDRTHSRNGKGADSLLVRRDGELVDDRWKAGGTSHRIAAESELPEPADPGRALPPAALRVLDVLTASAGRALTVTGIGDELAVQPKGPFKKRTIQDALAKLEDAELADGLESQGKSTLWTARQP